MRADLTVILKAVNAVFPIKMADRLSTVFHPVLRCAGRVVTGGLLCFGWAATAWAADLKVMVEGVSAGQGEVRVGLFDDANAFPRGKPKTGHVIAATGERMTVVFTDLPAGRYALVAFQDKNNNQKLDSNMVGLPTEPLGFSNKAVVKFGPPKFDDAAVTLGAEPLSIGIHLK